MIEEKVWTLAAEQTIAAEWKAQERHVDKQKKVYSIDTPPPYVNSPVHIGQAITYCFMDFFARYKRMKGYSVLFPLGLDRNGLPIEMAAQKQFDVTPEQVGRDKFMQLCREVLDKSSSESVDTFARLGISFNSYSLGTEIGSVYQTDSPEYRALTQSTFHELWKKGLVYEALRVSNYCPGCKTTLADAEITYEEKQTSLYHLPFQVKGTDEHVVVATTRPEFLASCAVVLCNPADERYLAYHNKTLITPVYGREIILKPHKIAKQDFGTGLVMMCSFGDLTDIRFFRDEKLPVTILIDEHGRMNEKSGLLQGLSIKQARKKIAEELKQQNLLLKEETFLHRAPVCERSKDHIEFIELKEFYLKQTEFIDTIRALAKDIHFYHDSSRQILLDWIDSVNQDWPLSRRRYYATPIPLWYCHDCNETIVGAPGKYWQPWIDKQSCPKCGKEAQPELRVFDTWFDSSISCMYILGYEKDPSFFKHAWPCSLRPQGKEIIRTWLYYTLLRSYQLTDAKAFENVWINYHILGSDGRKMSKSLGNFVDIKKILAQYGSESIRLWAALEGDLTRQDFACSEQKIAAEGKTLTKLFNIAKFVQQFPKVAQPELQAADKALLASLEEITALTNVAYEAYDFHAPAALLRNFIWETFASHYIELVKNRAYNQEKKFSLEEQHSAIFTLHFALERVLLLLAPVLPMITSVLYQHLVQKNIHSESFPEAHPVQSALSMQDITELNSRIWKFKKDAGKNLKESIQTMTIPQRFKTVQQDILNAHNISQAEFSDAEEFTFA